LNRPASLVLCMPLLLARCGGSPTPPPTSEAAPAPESAEELRSAAEARRRAEHLTSLGRFAAALDQAHEAEAIDPSGATDLTFARTYYAMHRFAEALDSGRRALAKTEPGDARAAHELVGFVLLFQGQHGAALRELEIARALGRDGNAALAVAYGYAIAGDTHRARQLLTSVEEHRATGDDASYRAAEVHLALGEKDRALELLQRAVAEKDRKVDQLRVDPSLDALHTDPRFQELVLRASPPVD
jgi:tetratricopeptide (TPR) repeat protein